MSSGGKTGRGEGSLVRREEKRRQSWKVQRKKHKMRQTERTRKEETAISLKKWLPSYSSPPALGTSMSSESLSRVRFFETPWAVVSQAPVSKEFSRQEYWSRLPLPSPRDLLNPGIEPSSLEFPALAGRFLTTSTTWGAQTSVGPSVFSAGPTPSPLKDYDSLSGCPQHCWELLVLLVIPELMLLPCLHPRGRGRAPHLSRGFSRAPASP